MSVVACKVYKDKIEIAADSAWNHDRTMQTISTEYTPKLFEYGDFIVGGIGSFEEIALMRTWTKQYKPKSNKIEDMFNFFQFFISFREKTGIEESKNEYIFVFKGKAFFTDGVSVSEIKDYYAIGSGKQFAYTCLHLGKGVKEAVKVACKLHQFCCDPVKFACHLGKV